MDEEKKKENPVPGDAGDGTAEAPGQEAAGEAAEAPGAEEAPGIADETPDPKAKGFFGKAKKEPKKDQGQLLAEAAEPVPYKAAPAAGKIGTGTEARAKALPEETESLPCPLPETEAVEDTYFDGAVFLGDSRTEGLSLYSGLKTGYFYTAVGATVESVFSKKNFETEGGEKVPLLDAVAEQDCDKIYIMLGINELGWSKVKTFHDQYAKLVDRVRADHPEAKIVLQSIPPVSAKQEAKKTYVNNARIAEYNGVIQALAEEKECYFLDVAACLTGGDRPPLRHGAEAENLPLRPGQRREGRRRPAGGGAAVPGGPGGAGGPAGTAFGAAGAAAGGV